MSSHRQMVMVDGVKGSYVFVPEDAFCSWCGEEFSIYSDSMREKEVETIIRKSGKKDLYNNGMRLCMDVDLTTSALEYVRGVAELIVDSVEGLNQDEHKASVIDMLVEGYEL